MTGAAVARLDTPLAGHFARLPPPWRVHPQDSLAQIAAFVDARRATGAHIYPSQPLAALMHGAPHDVRVLILGQDPYHGPGQAHGYAFSVPEGVRLPPSLRNIFQELARDGFGDRAPIGATDSAAGGAPRSALHSATYNGPRSVTHSVTDRATDDNTDDNTDDKTNGAAGPAANPAATRSGNLRHWSRQGVLLLNTVLTVEAGAPGSHAGRGWEGFTDSVMDCVARSPQPRVFLLWGAHAQAKRARIDAAAQTLPAQLRPLVLLANHPSPLSARRPPLPFIGCGHFSQANRYLAEKGCAPIAW
jgi:uracil-DNA glycosylase